MDGCLHFRLPRARSAWAHARRIVRVESSPRRDALVARGVLGGPRQRATCARGQVLRRDGRCGSGRLHGAHVPAVSGRPVAPRSATRCYRLREIVGIRPIRKCRRIPGTVRARGGNTCSWCCRESMPCAAGRRATEEWSDRTSKKIPKKIHFHTGYSPALSDQRWHTPRCRWNTRVHRSSGCGARCRWPMVTSRNRASSCGESSRTRDEGEAVAPSGVLSFQAHTNSSHR